MCGSYLRTLSSQTAQFRKASIPLNDIQKPPTQIQQISASFKIGMWLTMESPSRPFSTGSDDTTSNCLLVTLLRSPHPCISYASKLANLPAQFGLYTAFLGAFMYTFFATSKDVTIGATAVLSLVVGQQLATYAPANSTPSQLASFSATLAFCTGIFELLIGLFPIGHIMGFVPVLIWLQIIIQQFPGLLRLKGVNSNNAPYQVLRVFFGTLVNGATVPLSFILILKFATDYTKKRYEWTRFIGYLKYAIVLIIYTGISYAVRDQKLNFAIVQTIPSGLSRILKADYSLPYASSVMSALPPVLLVAILENIPVTKTYGRVNGRKVQSNQEIVIETAAYYGKSNQVAEAPDGVLVFKIDESLAYPNSSYFLELLNDPLRLD
ncbi:hypothetical protein BC830DRAFT_1083013 [Chytriomyces sp. MP71]|nr:hypothetical protein BC830DRAFT_1083013 [Chytriomyces sp. MP71]